MASLSSQHSTSRNPMSILPQPRTLIVEDKQEDLRTVMDCLADENFCGADDIVGTAESVAEAMKILDARSNEIDLVFLDLNLPTKAGDSSPEKLSGKRVLDNIHSLNGRSGVCIKVIIVSGEDFIEYQASQEMFLSQYDGTLVAIVQKADIATTLKNELPRFYADPLRDKIRKAGIGVLRHYDKIVDPKCDIATKLNEACSLAIRLMCDELECTTNRLGLGTSYGDNLNGLIWDLKKDRFKSDQKGTYYITERDIQSPGGWEAFLWRGTMEQHLQTLLRYRNDYTHMRAKPYRAKGNNSWVIPEELLLAIEEGKALSQVVELIVKEILAWYLPWHDQVYKPWREKKK